MTFSSKSESSASSVRAEGSTSSDAEDGVAVGSDVTDASASGLVSSANVLLNCDKAHCCCSLHIEGAHDTWDRKGETSDAEEET